MNRQKQKEMCYLEGKPWISKDLAYFDSHMLGKGVLEVKCAMPRLTKRKKIQVGFLGRILMTLSLSPRFHQKQNQGASSKTIRQLGQFFQSCPLLH